MTANTDCTGPTCTNKAWSKGLCHGHLAQQYKGKPLTPLRPKAKQGALHEAAARGAQGGRDCIEAGSTTGGRPISNGVRGARRHSLARTVWTQVHGDPGDLWILHACHNDRCVNVDHLYAGTPQQNTADREAIYQLGLEALRQRMAEGGPMIGHGGQDVPFK